MFVVVYCYLLLTVHQATYSVKEGVILNQSSPSLIFTSKYLCWLSLLSILYCVTLNLMVDICKCISIIRLIIFSEKTAA